VAEGDADGEAEGDADGELVGCFVGLADGELVGFVVGAGLVHVHVCTSGAVNSSTLEGQLPPVHVTPGNIKHLYLLSVRSEM